MKVSDTDALKNLLATSLPNGGKLTRVTAMTEGHSNESYFLEGLDLVLRVGDPAQGFLLEPHSLIMQANIMRAVADTGIGPPVPRIETVCEDRSVIGRPFFTMQYVDGLNFGEGAVAPWIAQADHEFIDKVMSNYLTSVSQINIIGPLALLGEPLTPLEEVGRWQRQAEVAQDQRLVDAIARLSSKPFPVSGPASLVHGDAKPGNTMWRGSELVAFLDWELAFNGDPLCDLGYILCYFASDAHPPFPGCADPKLWKRQQIIDYWQQATGRSAEGVEWFEARGFAMLASVISLAMHLASVGRFQHHHLERASKVRERVRTAMELIVDAL